MSEMLANHYFLARKFVEAEPELEAIVAKDPANKSARKKLIICYSQNHKIDEALDLFGNLISDDIEFVIDTDIIADDCPCPELVTAIEESDNYKFNYTEKLKVAGMLWLYCNFEKSFEYFKKLSTVLPNDRQINSILEIYKSYSLAHSQ